MLESPLQRLIPNAADLLSMSIEQLVPVLLRLAHEGQQTAGFVPHSITDISVSSGYPGWKKGEVETHLTRVWNLIERKGLIEPSPGTNGQHGWRMFTEEGEAVAKGADLAAIQQDFPTALLHAAIVAGCENLFRSGHYAQAVELSFKVVRDRLRQLTNYEKGADAFGKGKLYVRGAIAPHVDDDFNDGVKFLTMAIDMFRNEKAHTAKIGIDNPQNALQYLVLSSLAMRLLDYAEVQ